MAFTTTSKYAVLTSYMLMEYMYADSPTPEHYHVNTGNPAIGYNKIVNGYTDDDIHIFNNKINIGITNNTTENNVVSIGGGSYVTLDSNLIIPFNDFDDKLTKTIDLPVIFPSNISVVYDTIRFHIRAGYNLSNIDGLINTIKYEDQDGSYVTIASILIKRGTQQIYTLNNAPVKIGADIYDRYIEIKIPSLLDMQNKYSAAVDLNKPFTLAGLISKSGKGFNSLSPIRILVDEVNSISDYNGYPKYGTVNKATFSLEQENPFKNIGSVIKPSDSGEFFEFFATDDGGFIEDFILFQNSIGNSYFIYHQIEVIEQIGTAFIQTSNFSSNQTTAYDVPNLFRPIVRNASVANSFILRYTMSLMNNKDNTSIIRISSYTSNAPGKYGTRITPIKISQNPLMHKIYNKVYEQPSIQLNQIVEENKVIEIIKYANVFIQQMDVTAAIENLQLTSEFSGSKSIDLKPQSKGAGIIYGRGKGIIKISPFDNYLKFTFYSQGSDGIPDQIDLESSGNYKLIFIDNKGGKTTIDSLVNKNVANPAKGEIAFLIEESIAEKILNYTNENFYVANISSLEENTGGQSKKSDSTNVALGPIAYLTKAKNPENTIKSNISRINREDIKHTEPISKNTKKQIVNFGSSSVLYRGIWKPDINDNIKERIIEAPESIETTRTEIERTETDTRPNKPEVEKTKSGTEKKTSVGKIEPTAGIPNVDNPVNTGNSPVTESWGGKKLEGSNLISAIATLIQAFSDSGWTYTQIYNYFLSPGGVGYNTFPGMTTQEFAEAAEGIIHHSDGKPDPGAFGGKKPKNQ